MEKKTVLIDTYKEIILNYYEEISTLFVGEEKRFDYLTEEFNYITKLLKDNYQDKLTIESIALLKNITFSDFLKDKLIIESVSSNYPQLNNNSENIFIRKDSKHFGDSESLYKIVLDDGVYIATRYSQNAPEPYEFIINLDELNSFVSLRKAIYDSEYIGYSAKKHLDYIDILYDGKINDSDRYFAIYNHGNDLKICVNDFPYTNCGHFCDIYTTEKVNPFIKSKQGERRVKSVNDIEDKNFVYNVIIEQLKEKYNISSEVSIYPSIEQGQQPVKKLTK